MTVVHLVGLYFLKVYGYFWQIRNFRENHKRRDENANIVNKLKFILRILGSYKKMTLIGHIRLIFLYISGYFTGVFCHSSLGLLVGNCSIKPPLCLTADSCSLALDKAIQNH